jgi:glycosyltransferase involved in cell wall biosynthesis
MTLSAPLITIAMPAYNGERTVAQAIASIVNQTFENWELVVYDDGSSDRTIEAARRFEDARVRAVEGGANRGLPACLNRIVAVAESHYFARMDADDIAYPHRLESQLAFLRAHPEIDLVGGSMMVFRGDGTAVGVRRPALEHEQICAHPWSGIPVAHPTWMGRTEWFRRNPYREDAMRMEDRELLFRTHGTSRFANLPQVLLGYREDGVSLRKILTARRNACRMMLRAVRDGHAQGDAARAILGQAARGLVEIAAIGSGLGGQLLRHRNPPASADLIAEWKPVYEQTQAAVVPASGRPAVSVAVHA